jgi:hypothetical protein
LKIPWGKYLGVFSNFLTIQGAYDKIIKLTPFTHHFNVLVGLSNSKTIKVLSMAKSCKFENIFFKGGHLV